MNKKVAIIISPNYKDYARKYLAGCVDSLRKQDYSGELKIFIADNESSEESYEYVKKILNNQKEMDCGSEPAMTGNYEIIRNKNNDGFAKANNDCLKLALAHDCDYLFCLNMDAVMETDCVRKMVEAVENDKNLDSRFRVNDTKEIGAVQARLMLYNDKNKINSLGNVTHFLGFGYSLGNGEKIRGWKSEIGNLDVCYPSGAAVMFAAEALRRVGLFDEEFWMYNEDQDLGWRLWLSGYKCVLAPKAVVYHKYEFSRSIKKYYFMDRNRIIAMLKNYHWLTLALIFPAFLVMEIGLIFFAAKNGWFKEKIKVFKYFLRPKNWRYILAERKKIQNSRAVSDREIVKLFSGRIWYQEIGGGRLKIANVIFNIYWRIAKVFIIW